MNDRLKAAFSQVRADKALLDNTTSFLRGERERRSRSGAFRFAAGAGALAAAVLLVTGIISYNLYFTPVAYVGVDVNPSVELTLNRYDRVIDQVAYNPDGERILREVSLSGKTYGKAAELLFSAARASGYLAQDAQVFVSVYARGDRDEQTLCDSLLELASKALLAERESAEIEVFPVSSEVWESARSCHMSAAKYLAMQRLMQADETVTLEDYPDATVGQIRQRAQECENAHGQAGGMGGHGQGGGHAHGHR